MNKIVSEDYAGHRRTLVDRNDNPVLAGTIVRARTDDTPYHVVGGRAPHKSNSTGRVWVTRPDDDGVDTREFYPHVFDLRWVGSD